MRVSLATSLSCRIGVALCLCALAGITTDAQAEDAFTLRATAGLGGLVKAGRWAPVLIEIDNRGGESSGEIVVAWGDATLRRRVVFGSPGTRRFELYIRTADAEGVIRVGLNGLAQSLEVPVTVLPYDASVTVCVSEAGAWLNDASRCSTTLAPQQLPSSARGYEIADEVIVAGDPRSVSESQQVALDRWRSVRGLEAFGDLSLTSQVTRPLVRRGLPSASAEAVKTVAGVYLAVLFLVGSIAATTRLAPSRTWLAFGVAIASATAATLAIGRNGFGSQVTIHHTTLLQQIPGATGSLLTIRGVAEFPSNDETRLRVAAEDAMLEAAAASGRAEQVLDAQGYPIIEGHFGLGTRQAFTAEALVDRQWLTVAHDGTTVRISNHSNTELYDCRFADGMSIIDVGDLPPGSTVTAERRRDIAGPVFTCLSRASAIAFAEPSHVVEMKGTTTIAVYQTRAAATTLEAPND